MLTALIRIDCFLIDRVFQRVANAVERWTNCYAIAAFLIAGASIAQWASVLVNILRNPHWIGLLSAAGPAIITPIWYMWWKAADRLASAPPTNVMPIIRIELFITRSLYSVLLVPLNLLLFLPPRHVQDILFASSWLLVSAGLYFLACYRRPPRARKARSWGWIARLLPAPAPARIAVA